MYFDYQATTPVADEVIQVITECMAENWGNPSALGNRGERARHSIISARRRVAEFLGVRDREVFFTSGATEANNSALGGLSRSGTHVVVSSIEHKSVLSVTALLRERGCSVDVIPVDSQGFVDMKELANSLRRFPGGVLSVMAVNNETGVIQDIEQVSKLARDYGYIVHSDITQALGVPGLEETFSSLDAMSFSGHKIYGPKGIGVLVLRRKALRDFSPIFRGGGQQGGVRPGTENVPAIVGLARAIEVLGSSRVEDYISISSVRRQFLSDLMEEGVSFEINGALKETNLGCLNLWIDGFSRQQLQNIGPDFEFSQGSACSAGSSAPSHVLTAMGLSPSRTLQSIRIGFGRGSNHDEYSYLARSLRRSLDTSDPSIASPTT